MPANQYQRPKDGERLQFNGINIRLPVDKLPQFKYPYAQNVRNLLGEAVTGRNPESANLFSSFIGPAPVRTVGRLQDNTAPGGYSLVAQSDSSIYLIRGDNVLTHPIPEAYSGFPVSMVPFRPAASPQPWMYVADRNVMAKVSAAQGGAGWLMGIPEPQIAPTVALGGAGGPTGTYVYFGVWRSLSPGGYPLLGTGNQSNPSPVSAQISPSNQAVLLSTTEAAPYNTPPRNNGVGVMDYYRQSVGGGGLPNPTYVGTGTSGTVGFQFVDTSTDLDVANNPILEFDNYEPFPSIDYPRSGDLQWNGGSTPGTAIYISGDTFNTLWLPGTLIVMSSALSPFSVTGTLYSRPQSAGGGTMLIDLPYAVPIGVYQWTIQEPILAAQPMPAMWGPTDNASFFFACGDPLRPGVLYWTKGNNPDSAPDTNQQDVTAPSEPLMNGAIVNGLGMVFSTERAWLIYPNFFSALATVIGTTGQQWFLIESIATRGLFARFGICTDGGGTVYFRSKDGIYASPGGHGANSITDDDLYSLFPHETSAGQDYSITVGGTTYTVYAPDPAQSEYETLAISNGFVYWDYIDTHGTQRTLVFDTRTNGWVPDIYQVPASCHANAVGNVTQVLLGCTDGTIRQLAAGGPETGNAIILTNCFNAGDARADKRFGDIFLDAALPANLSVLVANDLFESSFTPATILAAAGALRKRYVVDIPHQFVQPSESDALWDLELVLTWAIGNANAIYVWQPSLVPMPETTQARPTDWDDAGTPGNKFFQGVIIEADTFGVTKSVIVENEGNGSSTLNEQFVFNGQSGKAFSFARPFTSHLVRLYPQDSVKWRLWGLKWVFVPYPELCQQWQTEGMSHGLIGWQHIREMNIAYLSALAPLTVMLTPDYGPPISLTVPQSSIQTKFKLTVPANKFKIMSYQITSTDDFYLWQPDIEVKVGQWGRQDSYRILRPFGGQSAMKAEV